MKFSKENLKLETALEKEWIITNGIGGFASSTIIGANTRKYHGLLVVPIIPPARRRLILSKLDESIEIDGVKYDLFTNIGKNYISQGYKYQESFIKEFFPMFEYKVNDVEITKMICMEHYKNTVGVYYKVKNGPHKAKLILAPIMNFRNAHGINKDHQFKLEQKMHQKKLEVKIDEQNPIFMTINDGNYIEHHNDTFYNMFYIEEEKRGFFPEENHVVSGVFEIEIEPNEEKDICFLCSMEENIDELNYKEVINNEIVRINNIYNDSLLIDNGKEKKTKEELEKDELVRTFLRATDNFVVYRPTFGLHTLIAGYPWFLDWGRDTLISFEGTLLIPKRFEIAKEILLTCTRDIKYGLLPNGYSDTSVFK